MTFNSSYPNQIFILLIGNGLFRGNFNISYSYTLNHTIINNTANSTTTAVADSITDTKTMVLIIVLASFGGLIVIAAIVSGIYYRKKY